MGKCASSIGLTTFPYSLRAYAMGYESKQTQKEGQMKLYDKTAPTTGDRLFLLFTRFFPHAMYLT